MNELFSGHPFWGLLTVACLAWYSTITITVAGRGARDIRRMLDHLRPPGPDETEEKR